MARINRPRVPKTKTTETHEQIKQQLFPNSPQPQPIPKHQNPTQQVNPKTAHQYRKQHQNTQTQNTQTTNPRNSKHPQTAQVNKASNQSRIQTINQGGNINLLQTKPSFRKQKARNQRTT